MCSKDKFNTTHKITQLEIRCFINNTKNYFEIMVLVRKDNNPHNKNIYVYIIILIIAPKKYLNVYVTRKLINSYNTPHQCTSSLSTHNNKNHIKISINPIVLLLLIYCYSFIVNTLWLLHSYIKIGFIEVLLNSTTIPYIKSTYDSKISNNKYKVY